MSDKDLRDSIKRLKALRQEHTASPKKALAFLVKAGIATKSGKLAKPYRQGA